MDGVYCIVYAHGFILRIQCNLKKLLPQSVSRKTLMKYSHKLVNVVETKVSQDLPYRFSITFDVWSGAETHSDTALASCPLKATCRYDMFVLRSFPTKNDDSLNSEKHYEYLVFVLSVFGRDKSNVVEVTVDNSKTNRSMACRTDKHLLAAKDIVLASQCKT